MWIEKIKPCCQQYSNYTCWVNQDIIFSGIPNTCYLGNGAYPFLPACLLYIWYKFFPDLVKRQSYFPVNINKKANLTGFALHQKIWMLQLNSFTLKMRNAIPFITDQHRYMTNAFFPYFWKYLFKKSGFILSYFVGFPFCKRNNLWHPTFITQIFFSKVSDQIFLFKFYRCQNITRCQHSKQ